MAASKRRAARSDRAPAARKQHGPNLDAMEAATAVAEAPAAPELGAAQAAAMVSTPMSQAPTMPAMRAVIDAPPAPDVRLVGELKAPDLRAPEAPTMPETPAVTESPRAAETRAAAEASLRAERRALLWR
ncbi:MAG TPA: hypothetical protein VNL77_00595, partial [Roseiflexaceae bacterium]|nr:hypothetical protein [Roseiflexaceae bacterium]